STSEAGGDSEAELMAEPIRMLQ
ncbi:hypothetical protein CCACVL1_30480, partial [Corchorus capsularis]